MKGFRLERLLVEDFMDSGTLVLTPRSQDLILRGDCGSGKTAVRQAFTWLLLIPAPPRWSAVEAHLRTEKGVVCLRRDFGFSVDGVRCSEDYYRRRLEQLLEPWQLRLLLSWDSLLKEPWLWHPLLQSVLGQEGRQCREALKLAIEADVHLQAQKLRGQAAKTQKAVIRQLRARQAGLCLGRVFPGFGFHRQPWGWEVSWRGIPWDHQSPARQMLTGLALRQTLCRLWQVEVPLFLDDGVLLTQIPAVGSQLILLLTAPCPLTAEERR